MLGLSLVSRANERVHSPPYLTEFALRLIQNRVSDHNE